MGRGQTRTRRHQAQYCQGDLHRLILTWVDVSEETHMGPGPKFGNLAQTERN